MDKTTVGNLCKPYVGQLRLDDDTLIDYFDISSVDNIEKRITGYTTYTFAKAPSRARKQVKKGDILVSTVRPNLNAVALFDKETKNTPVVSTGLCVLECKADTSPRFLLRYLQSKSFVRAMVSQATGASYPAVSDKIVRDAQIPAYSYEEQIQIANVLDATANIISKQKQQLQKLDDLIKARFVELFGDPIINSRGWQAMALENNATLLNGRAYKQDELLDRGKYPVLRVGNFFSNRGWFYSDLELEEDKYCNNGDLLYAWSASFGPQIWRGSKVIYHYHIWKVLVGKAYNKQFLCSLLEYTTKRLMHDTHGIAMMHLTKSGMEKTEFIVPPMELQEQFAAFVEQTDKSKVAIQKARDETQVLFESLMQKYFGGI